MIKNIKTPYNNDIPSFSYPGTYIPDDIQQIIYHISKH